MRFDRENRVAVSSTALAQSAAASKNAPDLASPCCASNENSCFKENVNINKSEAPKLSLEPLQMKRKKKGGGYNLRKSLAWDRAFFTEEGVLDPLELSAISGLSCREGLPFISEDTPGDSQQDEDFIKDRKKDWSSPKLNSSSSNLMTSTSLTSHEVPTYLGGKTGSRCGDCPLPLPSPSLKRPANVNVGKAAGKELKLPKVSGLKPGNSPTCTTRSTILRANRMKHNQITQLDFSIQRHAEPKSSSKHLNNTQNALRANGLQSAHHSDENSGNSSFNRHSSITMRPVMVDKANNSGPKMISDNATKIRPQKTSEGQRYDSKNFAAPFSQNAHISGRTMHPLQNQATKPSGLRMPSPSLSFFSQPKPLVSRDLPLRDTETDVFGSQKPGNLRLLDILRRTPRMYGKLPESTVSCSKDVSSTSECVAPSHVSAVELIKPNLEQNTMHKIQDLPKKNIITRISHEEAELQKIGTEVPSQSGSGEQTIDETISSIDEPPKEKNTCNFLVLNHGSTQCAEAPDDKVQNTLKVQSDGGKTCKRDCHEPDPLKCSSWETDKRTDNENVLKKKERASEERGVSQQSGSCCSGGVKALEQRQTKAENPYFVSKLLHGDLLKESASIEVLTNNIPAGEAHIQNSVSDLNIGDSKNDINLMPEVGHDINQPRKGSEGKNICLKVEMELENSIKLNTSDRLSSEKQILLQNSQQEENVQKPPSVIPDRKDGNKVTDTKMQISLSPGRRHDSNLRREETTAEPVLSVEFDCVDNFLSSESRNSSVDTIFDCDDKSKGNSNILLNGIPDGNLSNCLPRETQRTEIDNCSPLPESRIHLLSQKDTPRKVTEEGPCIQDSSADNWLISSMSSEDSESDIDNLTGLQDIGKVVGQSPKSNMLNYCCLKQSESMAIANDEFVTENLVHSNGRLQTESHADMYSGDNPSGSMQDSVTGQNEMCLNISKSSSFSEKESPLEEERCSAHENRDLIADAITDPSRVKTFSGTIMGEVSEDINNSFSCLHPKLGPVKVEATLAPKNKHGNGHNKKSRSLILPQNAIPFSDEWLAAIEAAGEDILTRKSGAVQNSPPDKSVPEPSPWSPVKKKNNQIGPFDCTKFTAPSN